jgi:hypothetical protein
VSFNFIGTKGEPPLIGAGPVTKNPTVGLGPSSLDFCFDLIMGQGRLKSGLDHG